MRVRAARPSDGPELTRVAVAAVRALEGGAYDHEQLDAWARSLEAIDWPSRFAEAASRTWVAEDERVQGFARTALDELDLLYVLPAVQGQGVGAALLARAEDAARASGETRLRLASSLDAVGFYRSHGYKGALEERVELGGGVSLTRLWMRKALA